jgi:hypothetical protein
MRDDEHAGISQATQLEDRERIEFGTIYELRMQ